MAYVGERRLGLRLIVMAGHIPKGIPSFALFRSLPIGARTTFAPRIAVPRALYVPSPWPSPYLHNGAAAKIQKAWLLSILHYWRLPRIHRVTLAKRIFVITAKHCALKRRERAATKMSKAAIVMVYRPNGPFVRSSVLALGMVDAAPAAAQQQPLPAAIEPALGSLTDFAFEENQRMSVHLLAAIVRANLMSAELLQLVLRDAHRISAAILRGEMPTEEMLI